VSNWPHALRSPEQAAFEDLWIHRTSLGTNEEPEKLALAPWERSEGALTESESTVAAAGLEGSTAEGSTAEVAGDAQPQQRPASNAATRIYVLYGQYGYPTSSGMYALAQTLGRYGKVTTHYWDDRTIVSDAKQQSGKIVIIGYSLGANSAALIANRLPRVELVVAYDPSRLSPLAQPDNGEYTEAVTPNVRRAISFYNPNAWYFGGARLSGPQVEIIPINDYHLAVPADWRLHEITEEAVKKVALESPERRIEAPNGGSEKLLVSGRGGAPARSGAAALSPRTRTAAADG
jgi:pimeloyl-ACP methyl ester carboxylesterase